MTPEKQFITELLRKPDHIPLTRANAAWWMQFKIMRIMVDYMNQPDWEELVVNLSPDIFPRLQSVLDKVEDLGLDAKDYVTECAVNSGYMLFTFQPAPSPTAVQYLLSKAIKDPDFPTYVFAKEFWRVLRKTKIPDIEKQMPEAFEGCIRFPEPLQYRGITVSEVICSLGDLETGRVVYGIGKTTNTLTFFCPESLHDAPELTDLWKAIIYITSGTPDCRDQKNKIRYTTNKQGKKRPIKEHEDLSTVPFKFIGYDWMKLCEQRQYTKQSWLVEPFGRYQPYGPRGNQQYKFIIVDGHERHRRIPKENQPRDSQASSESPQQIL